MILCACLAAIPFARAADDDVAAPPAAPATNSAIAPLPAVVNTNITTELSSTNGLILNFHEAPLGMVLDYLSEKAGYVIVSDEDMRQKVTLESATPVSKDELRDLLNTVLSKNGYHATISGRTLTIKSNGNASSSELPVSNTSDPDLIPINDTVGTWILGVHSLEPKQLLTDLESLIPQGAKVSANEAGNAIIMTAPGKDVHHFALILKALDSSAVSSVAVFLLKYADSKSVASELKEVFQSPDSGVSRANRAGQQTRFRGFGGGGFNPFGGGGGPGGGGDNGTEKNAATESVFTSDDQMNAVIAATPPELMPNVTNIIQQLDQPTEDITQIRIFRLHHADATETADEINSLFTSNDQNNNNNGRGGGFQFFRGPFGFPGGGGGGGGNSQSDRMKRQTTVNAVADPRTSSVMVTASRGMMQEIAGAIADLDQSDAHAQAAYSIDISGADPADINTAMQTLFAGQNHQQQNSTLTESALQYRTQQANQQQNANAATSFGTQNTGGGGSTGR
jgi:type II secretory pathway component GspD/PulD (secretin)